MSLFGGARGKHCRYRAHPSRAYQRMSALDATRVVSVLTLEMVLMRSSVIVPMMALTLFLVLMSMTVLVSVMTPLVALTLVIVVHWGRVETVEGLHCGSTA